MLPFLLIILHFSQIGFTDDLTFTATASLPKKSNCNYSTIFSIWQALFKNSFIIYFYGRRYKREIRRKGIHKYSTLFLPLFHKNMCVPCHKNSFLTCSTKKLCLFNQPNKNPTNTTHQKGEREK